MPDSLRNRRVTVMGLGRWGGGVAVARWLVEQGARVLVTDRDPAEKLADSLRQLDGLPIEFRLGEHRESDFTSADLIVALAAPPTNPFLQAATTRGIPITTEIRLFIQRNPARRTIGITGTKGKSTTTAMLGKMLAPHFKTWVGGNIGASLLADLRNIKPDDVVVLELSSFMLEYLRPERFSPHIAVVTMITADHLDWHGQVEAYVDAKRNIVRFQKPTDFAILPATTIPNAGADAIESLARLTPAKIIRFADTDAPFALNVPGPHNQLNAQAAFAAAVCLGITRDQAQHALTDFAALPHRLQLVHEANGIRWIDDSIATGPDAAIAALNSFPPNTVIQIVGGKDKTLDMTPLAAALARRAKTTICQGATGPQIAALIRQAAARADVREAADLGSAIKLARTIARPGDVVLLSPGYASFDQHANYQARGQAFARLAREEMS